MKLLSILGLSLLLSYQSSAQQDVEQELLQSYTKSELNSIKKDQPERYRALVYGVNNALDIVDFPKGKESKTDGNIDLPSGDYSFCDLGLKIKESNQYFKINGTNKLLVVKSFYLLENELK